ncbi:GIY-YIG nuclease family protein [Patescibacteria group bacterium]|nr:GIY-YIG nuclease family protein [Patescibacteria group bacterium]
MNTWSVYILRCRDTSLYTGISTNVENRINVHNQGKGAAYTRSRLPVLLLWQEDNLTESVARKREAEIKRWKKEEKEKFIKSCVQKQEK